MSDIKNDIELIIAKELVEEATADEKRTLESWLAESESNQKVYNQYQKLFAESKNTFTDQEDIDINIEAEWQKFQSSINETKVISMDAKPQGNVWLKIAASVLLFMSITYAVYLFNFKEDFVRLQTADTKEEFVLPDGSNVTLNVFSSVTYSSGFGSEHRNLDLEGEAFFDVQRNEDVSFKIATHNAEVSVLGTSFNVVANDEVTEVIVSTGLVALKNQESEEDVKLKPGDKGTLNDGNLSVSANDNPNFDAWNTGIIIFENADLVAVVNAINKVYRTNISISPNVSQNCMVTVTFEQQSLEAVLSVLESTLDLVIERNGDDVEITKAGC